MTSVTLSVFVATTAPPAPAAATFVSTLVARVVQEPTDLACTTALNQWQEQVDAILVNAQPGTAYDIYIQPNNGTAGFVTAGPLTTNAQGNAGAIFPVTETPRSAPRRRCRW